MSAVTAAATAPPDRRRSPAPRRAGLPAGPRSEVVGSDCSYRRCRRLRMLGLSADELLTTTRAVRKRLDFDRPVDPGLMTECLDIALQAPSGGNRQDWVWMVVADPAKKAALAELYRQAWAAYRESPHFPTNERPREDPAVQASFERIADSAQYLSDNLERAPLFLIPCLAISRVERPSWGGAASRLGSVIQASWSFMLAARERGLGTCW
ncbi:MAG: nitroreductase family protein, partial [Acidimicrobiaceae bacterium]|nr:nitroreductase family protein [Acidimicrobiaceae bacterium]